MGIVLNMFKRPKPDAASKNVKVSNQEDYRSIVLWLMDEGCEPYLGKRGKNLYRFHVNRAGNFWADAATAHEACEIAVNDWLASGKGN